MGDDLQGSIGRIVGGGDMLELLPEEQLVELPEAGLVCLGLVVLGAPRVVLGNAGTEGNEKKEGQRVALVLIATAVIDQADAADEARKFHNLKSEG